MSKEKALCSQYKPEEDNVMRVNKQWVSMSQKQLENTIAQSAELVTLMRQNLHHIEDPKVVELMMTLNASLVVADVIKENWDREFFCHVCECDATINEDGVANHILMDGSIDHNADAEHTPYELKE
jgi:hypothetical protein